MIMKHSTRGGFQRTFFNAVSFIFFLVGNLKKVSDHNDEEKEVFGFLDGGM